MVYLSIFVGSMSSLRRVSMVVCISIVICVHIIQFNFSFTFLIIDPFVCFILGWRTGTIIEQKPYNRNIEMRAAFFVARIDARDRRRTDTFSPD